ncbi:hypothetical protein FB451DRAFT_785287 [Mycena latifolia]|nr:hypothetical protein FB451DRAFT_785287 [Mycena latifolia]
MNFKIFAFLALAFFLAAVNPSLGKETNASRLRRGLPPLPPRSLFRNKGAIGWTASATTSSRPSSTPRPRFSSRSGRIQVLASNGSSLGFVGNSTPVISINFGGDPGQDLRIQIVSESAPFNIIVTNPNFPTPFYLGALASSNLSLEKLTTVALSNVDRARSKSRATASEKGFVQSAIWSIDLNTQELKARYVNPDGTKSPLFVVYNAHYNELHFVGNVDSDNLANPGFPGSAVKLYLSED